MNSPRAQWMAIIGGFLVLVLVAVVLGAIVGAVTQQSSEVAEQASSSEDEAKEAMEEVAEETTRPASRPKSERTAPERTAPERTREKTTEATTPSLEEQEARRERALSEARTPEERVTAIVEYMPQFERLESGDPRRVWVRFYNDNGCLDVLVKYRTPGISLFGSQADSIESNMWSIYGEIHSDPAAHAAVCDISIEAYGDITDDYGKATEEMLYKTTLSRDVAARVNWSNAASVNYTELWQVDTIHPQLEAERVQEDAQQALDCLQEGGMFDFDWLECP